MSQGETFSIRQMVELTGLSEFTIRGWETRYSAFEPRRGETGRRRYLKRDVERALLLRELLKRGHKIGKVATLSNQKLKELFEVSDSVRQDHISDERFSVAVEAIEFMTLQKWNELDQCVKSVRMRDTSRLIRDFFLPLLQALSENVNAGLVSIAQEHILSSFLKEKIYTVLNELDRKKNASRRPTRVKFVLATPEGDYHELGLLLAHLLIRSYGIKSLYLGVHSPARALSETILRFNASHALIVSTASKKNGSKQDVLSFVSEVQKQVGPRVQILLAGSQAPLAENPSPSLSILQDFPALDRLLNKIGIGGEVFS